LPSQTSLPMPPPSVSSRSHRSRGQPGADQLALYARCGEVVAGPQRQPWATSPQFAGCPLPAMTNLGLSAHRRFRPRALLRHPTLSSPAPSYLERERQQHCGINCLQSPCRIATRVLPLTTSQVDMVILVALARCTAPGPSWSLSSHLRGALPRALNPTPCIPRPPSRAHSREGAARGPRVPGQHGGRRGAGAALPRHEAGGFIRRVYRRGAQQRVPLGAGRERGTSLTTRERTHRSWAPRGGVSHD
jgi:hypothetical protein